MRQADGTARRAPDGKRGGQVTASRDRFTEQLAQHETALRALSGDVLYKVQCDLICEVLDTADQVADEQTAGRLADALAARWAADVATVAAARAEIARASALVPWPSWC